MTWASNVFLHRYHSEIPFPPLSIFPIRYVDHKGIPRTSSRITGDDGEGAVFTVRLLCKGIYRGIIFTFTLDLSVTEGTEAENEASGGIPDTIYNVAL